MVATAAERRKCIHSRQLEAIGKSLSPIVEDMLPHSLVESTSLRYLEGQILSVKSDKSAVEIDLFDKPLNGDTDHHELRLTGSLGVSLNPWEIMRYSLVADPDTRTCPHERFQYHARLKAKCSYIPVTAEGNQLWPICPMPTRFRSFQCRSFHYSMRNNRIPFLPRDLSAISNPKLMDGWTDEAWNDNNTHWPQCRPMAGPVDGGYN